MSRLKSKYTNKKSDGRGIQKAELIVLFFFAVFGIVWNRFVIPAMQESAFFNSLNPVEAYFTYNLGLILIFIAFLGLPVGYFIHGNVNILDTIRGGLSVFIGFSWVVDLLAPPFAWNRAGDLVIPLTHENMEITAVDYMFGWLFIHLGIDKIHIYDMVTSGVPIFTVIIIAVMSPPIKLFELLGLWNSKNKKSWRS